MEQARFIIKVLIISIGLSALIKYSSPIYIPATPINVLIIVFTPSLILAAALWWRSSQQLD